MGFEHLQPTTGPESIVKVLHIGSPSACVDAVCKKARIDKVVFVSGKFILIVTKGDIEVPYFLHHTGRGSLGMEDVDSDYLSTRLDKLGVNVLLHRHRSLPGKQSRRPQSWKILVLALISP